MAKKQNLKNKRRKTLHQIQVNKVEKAKAEKDPEAAAKSYHLKSNSPALKYLANSKMTMKLVMNLILLESL